MEADEVVTAIAPATRRAGIPLYVSRICWLWGCLIHRLWRPTRKGGL